MARREILVDDLDGTEDSDENPVLKWRFGVGPTNDFQVYDIDLTQDNYHKLVEAMGPYIDHAAEVDLSQDRRSVGATRKRAPRGSGPGAGPKPVTEKGHTAEDIRLWLRENGFGDLVKGQGRLSKEAIERWDDATDHKKDKYLGAKAAAERGIALASDSKQAS